MRDATAAFVYPILDHGLTVRRRLGRGGAPAFDRERAGLRDRILAACDAPAVGPVPTGQPSAPGTNLGGRYLLACWLDEIFTRAPEWADRWNERKLEIELYGTNDRAWKFWDVARLAEQQPDDDALEVAYLAVRLGFRGTLGESEARLTDWLSAARERLGRLTVEPTPYDLEPDPVADVPPHRGERRFERMTAVVGAVVLTAVPLAAFLVAAGGRR